MNFSENFLGLKFSSFILKFSNSEMCLCHQLSLSLFDGKSLMLFQILKKKSVELKHELKHEYKYMCYKL